MTTKGRKVFVSASEVRSFKRSFPVSGLPDRAVWFEFSSNGDLVDMPSWTSSDKYRDAGYALQVLSQDAQKFLNSKKSNPSPPKDKWLPVSAVKFNQNGSVSMRGSRLNPSRKRKKYPFKSAEEHLKYLERTRPKRRSKRKIGNPTNYYVRGKAFAHKLNKISAKWQRTEGGAMSKERARRDREDKQNPGKKIKAYELVSSKGSIVKVAKTKTGIIRIFKKMGGYDKYPGYFIRETYYFG
jgi:hypothetical protein